MGDLPGKVFFVCFLFFISQRLNAQDLNGVWMSHHFVNIDTSKDPEPALIHFYIDFDQRQFKVLNGTRTNNIEIYDQEIRVFKDKSEIILEFQYLNDQTLLVTVPGYEGTLILKRLNLLLELDSGKESVLNFFKNQNFYCESKDLTLEFLDSKFFRDVEFDAPNPRNTLLNHTWEDVGNWYIEKIRNAQFLVMEYDQISPICIYQITKVGGGEIHFKPLVEPVFDTPLKILKMQ